MQVAVVRESAPGETRVALTPEVAQRRVKAGHGVRVEQGAGERAGHLDAAYEAVGARVAAGPGWLQGVDVLLGVQPPEPASLEAVPAGTLLVSFLLPSQNAPLVRALCARGLSMFALDLVPRLTRAQSMDALSSMSTVAGYRAALLAAQHLGRFFPMLMTAAGTIPPARVLVIGAGVAGLQAIATARRLGAIVEAYDVRPEAREQARSLGATAIEVDVGESGTGEGGYARKLSAEAEARLAARLAERVKAADAVITTALVPGKPAPRLIDEATVRGMRPGAVVVDLAAETGGNCAGTEAHRVVVKHHVTLVGTCNLPATMAADASRMLAKNMHEILKHLTPPPPAGGQPAATGVHLDVQDEITAGALAVLRREARHPAVKAALGAGERA
ncbi:MAG: Re/Si-specific NAD(P)(+) transhydrogenase subunit alpha [Planctomycetia bacterium]